MSDWEYTTEELAELIGKVPGGGIPAAWWVTINPDQLAFYDQWSADYDAHHAKVQEFAETLGLTANQARMSSWGGVSTLTGFDPPGGMYLWSGNPDYLPVPEGWRLDKKRDRFGA